MVGKFTKLIQIDEINKIEVEAIPRYPRSHDHTITYTDAVG